MNLNGQTVNASVIKGMGFFENINLNELPDTLEEAQITEDVSAILREANISGNIPKRFSNCRLDNTLEYTEKVWRFIKNPKDHILVLTSPVGCGKTTLVSSIMHERAILGMSGGLYFSDLTLAAQLESCRSFAAKENKYDFLQRLANVEFLVIDEYGADPNFAEETQFVSTVLRMRYDNELPTAVATNHSLARFKLSLCGVDASKLSIDEMRQMMPVLEKENPTLNRVVSVLEVILLKGESNRGKLC